jgi:1-deoxy-D-xylulose-5-phosphate reductoisomerase
MKRIAILGATGSIGQNCLDVIDRLPGQFEVAALSAHKNTDLLLRNAKKYQPRYVAMTGEKINPAALTAFVDLGITVFTGENALERLVLEADYDLLLNAVVGAVGFVPTLRAIERGKDIALANKETLVIGGELVTEAVRRNNVALLPVDSEHSALFQCLLGEEAESIQEIILTASGGPFRDLPASDFRKVTVAQALKHPNWNMGKKITIDSATMMNKGLEVIEAHWLFQVKPSQIRVVVHPQSIIHSMVLFKDGSYKAQLGMPDMRVPIQFAMTYPVRSCSDFPRLDFTSTLHLSFEQPDLEKFKALKLAYSALEVGGTAPGVMNAANEVAVHLFLSERIRFDQIADLIEQALEAHRHKQHPSVEDLLHADRWARNYVMRKSSYR